MGAAAANAENSASDSFTLNAAPAEPEKPVDTSAAPVPAGGGSTEELAKKLQNPVANLISIPFQFNPDFGLGEDEDGEKVTLNIQPVVPVSINKDWNVIIRTIVPVIYQDDVVNDGGSTQFGLGDTTQSFFFSPQKPTSGGLIWGVGPAFLWPTGTNDSLGSDKWGVGPTGVFLWQKHGWTYGLLANHIWSYAGDDDQPDVNSTFLQPFGSYTWKNGFSLGVNTESTYDWTAEQWTVPINVFGSQLVRLGKLPVDFTLGGRYYIEAPDDGPEWGFRFVVTLLLPK
jgi:hypothetical protein